MLLARGAKPNRHREARPQQRPAAEGERPEAPAAASSAKRRPTFKIAHNKEKTTRPMHCACRAPTAARVAWTNGTCRCPTTDTPTARSMMRCACGASTVYKT